MPVAPRAIQTFEVSLKAFIVRGRQALLVRESDTGFWELPGGRIDVGEEWVAHAEVLAREIAEELGKAVAIEVSDRAVTWVRQRPADGVYQLIIARPSRLVSGGPVLSAEHSELAWLDRAAALQLGFPPTSGYQEALVRLFALASQ